MIVGRIHGLPASPLWSDGSPVRGELFSVERLEEHALSLAGAQGVSEARARGAGLVERLADNAAFLRDANRAIAKSVADGQQITPAAEWLIDNYHLVDMQIREIRVDLPRRYYSQLPKLADGPFAGLPRVFGATWSLVAHTDSRFDPEALRRYLLAYQSVEPLTIGELWAVPITLRIVLIENLRRIAAMVVKNAAGRREASDFADRLLSHDPAERALDVLAVAGHVASTDAFAVELARRLRGQDPQSDPALAWLDRQLALRSTSIDLVVRDELQRQGASNATVQNVIGSLRLTAGLDWTEFFESVCLVDGVLAEGCAFREMTFPTRNLYRAAVEDLARGSAVTELDVARRAVVAASGPSGRKSDPGFHLFSDGRRAFETSLAYRPPLRARFARSVRAGGIAAYGAAIVATAIAFVAVALWLLAAPGIAAPWLALLGLVGFVPASDAAVACINRLAMFAFGASSLPGLELRDGIAAPMRTLVAVPTLLTNQKAIADQVAGLEIHHLASPDGDLHFALLSDWTDSPTEQADGDAALLAAATEGIAALNRRYGPAPGGDRFLLLHRRRVWNEGQASWIGWERKRGKLHELNRALRGAVDTTFLANTTGNRLPDGVRYVVTLDGDTRLPREAVRRLVGKMAHKLNAPEFDAARDRVVQGYSVLQPRVTPALPVGHDSTFFQRVFSSMDGIDPYASAVSDVYQDMFGEGSYAGKGIYDIDAFEAALHGRAGESSLLSHDLFEGMFARAGLASDVEVVEDFPDGYAVAALRQHRWARGDWQLLPWIMPWPTPRTARAVPGSIPTIGRMKMLDNLRRTLSAPAAVVALLAGWMLPFGAALGWTAFVLATVAVPALLPVFGNLVPRGQWVNLRSYLGVLGNALGHAASLASLIVVFMAHQATVMADAILRTISRVSVTRRNLLQWTTAAQAAAGPRLGLAGHYRRMVGAPAIGVLALAIALWSHPWVWLLAGPFAVAWIASPAVAFRVSRRSPAPASEVASDADRQVLRTTARRTWRFFETFVTPADNMLPPDNFQEDPAPIIAHRTSPTNFGLYLLSAVSAHDFGWVGLADTVERLEATFVTLGKLERFRGHFFNWYDTADLRPLDPRYVSTVDSGNLAGHLIALAVACREWGARRDPVPRWRAGAEDAIGLASDELKSMRLPPAEARILDGSLAALLDRVRRGSDSTALDDIAGEAATIVARAQALADALHDGGDDLVFWTTAIQRTIESARRDIGAVGLAQRLAMLERDAHAMALSMDFRFLRNEQRKLLSIGYLVAEGVLDINCYDLLASEARLASFVAIAKDDVPAREWFRLGRAVTPTQDGAALVSWSGSMFEYLMPSLVMRAPEGSLLDQTNRRAVRCQIAFGAEHHLPWGVSESAYNVRDLEYTYQYSNFGMPGLGLKRGLDRELVIAPYATALASMVEPREAVLNLGRLAAAGGQGRHGFYEALDYTPERIPDGQTVAVVRAFMAHHQGMTIVAIADAVLDGIMRSRFHAEPMIRATELLLQERAPRDAAVARLPPENDPSQASRRQVAQPGGRRFDHADGPAPATHLLSNGRYAVMLTAAGSGYSRWQGIDVTRWREDATLDDWGSYVYLRDVASGKVWSAGLQPTGCVPDEYDVAFNEDRAGFARRDGTLMTVMEVLVSPEDDAEVRRISITNGGEAALVIDVTSYAELALIPQAADIAHPAFAKLFVETEWLPGSGAILATRRRRTPEEAEIWAAHLVVADRARRGGDVEVETDRARFIGRGHTARAPAAVMDGAPLTGTVGTVLDAVFALRCRVTVPPGSMVQVAFWTMVASSREELVGRIDRHRDPTAFERASTLSWTQAQVQLRHLGIQPGEADLYQRLAGHLLFAGPALRPPSAVIRHGAGPQPGLWPQGISGDLPILLLRIDDAEDLDVARQLLRAHEYFRLKQLAVDVVILNEHAASYSQELQIALETLVRTQSRAPSVASAAKPGAIFLLRADLVPAATTTLLIAVARVVLVASRGRLSEQLRPPAHVVAKPQPAPPSRDPGRVAPLVPPLEFANGLGGFALDGREYVVVLGPGQTTPAPWINVVANPGFGFQASAEGSGYTWAANSRENQVTPWSNDPVTDRASEAFYLRDGDTGDVWCPTAAPRRDARATYVARHGRGYSGFDRVAHGIASSLVQFVPPDDPVKISRLRLRNTSGRERAVCLTAYVEWVLGPSRTATSAFVSTEIDAATGAMFARNPWSGGFGGQVAFADLRGAQTSWTGDRREFIGRNGSLAGPVAVSRDGALSNFVGAGVDPCGALRTTLHLAPGAEAEIVMLLGEATDEAAARALVARYREADLDGVLSEVGKQWDRVLGAVTVTTPDRSMDIMLNGWLLYQTLACRVWARAGFYQASGAYGFRDQLQDGMALALSRPDLVRAHLLRAASRQFVEGDVQHWWLPNSGVGVRTHISDDRAWLAYITAHYVAATGDAAVLDEAVPFLTAPVLTEAEHDRFFTPAVADETADLFEHCARALDHSLVVGEHGLPLMGTGDWNDGMSRVGEAGRGESVWLGWFLHTALGAFIPIAEARGDAARASAWREHAAALVPALERAWDGEWYLRAYFDDGSKLGTHLDDECRIDSIAQSWSVLSGAAAPDRAAEAMGSVARELVRDGEHLIRLFAPPFDKIARDPGYIRGYPPGVRENGGQYTHAALWTVMAFAALGDGDRAASLFHMLNPINHALTPADAARYRLEPYVIAADVYAMPRHVGRGGWSWYTGSAGWMQRAGVESILGIRVFAGLLRIDPCIPKQWPRFEVTIATGAGRTRVRVENPDHVSKGVVSITIDGVSMPADAPVELASEGTERIVVVTLG